jgi:probable HAF family extracellular repeat protein
MLAFSAFSAPLCGEPLQLGFCPTGGATSILAWGIDTAGTIVGQYDDKNGTHGFVFSNGVFSALNVPGATKTYAYGISANGRQIVGYDTDQAGQMHGFRLDAAGYTILDVPGAVAAGINDAGQIVGFATDQQGGQHGFLYTGGASTTTLDAPGAVATQAMGINYAGQIVGSYQDGNQRWHGFLYAGGTFTTLDYPGGTSTYAHKINDTGQIAGTYQDGNQQCHGFLYAGGTFTTLDYPGGANTQAHAINNAGQVAGNFIRPSDHLVVGFFTGAGGWPQQGQIPPALVNTWDWSTWTQIGWPGQVDSYRLQVSHHLVLGADGGYEFSADIQKVFNSWDLCPNGNPKGVRNQEHDFGTFVVQGSEIVLTVQRGTQSSDDNCNPASNFQVSTAGKVNRLEWFVGLSPQDQLLALHDESGNFLYKQNTFFSPNVPIPVPNFFPGVEYDFNGDGKSDILWHNTSTGDVAVWLMNGVSPTRQVVVAPGVPLAWQIVGVGDLDGDGKADLVWRNTTTGDVAVWLMNGVSLNQAAVVASAVPPAWQIVGVGDLDGDGKADLVWRNTTTGDVAVWLMNGVSPTQQVVVAPGVPLAWQIVGVGDLDGDGKADLVWRNTTTGDVAVWLMNGVSPTQQVVVAPGVPLAWQIQ